MFWPSIVDWMPAPIVLGLHGSTVLQMAVGVRFTVANGLELEAYT